MRVFLLFVLASLLAAANEAAEARILKVLPHLLDAKGRHALSPSLYERDAYQARLRADLELVKGMRFDVNWTAPKKGQNFKLRLEVRGGNSDLVKPVLFEQEVTRRGWRSTWSTISLSQEQYAQVGQVIAWRATLWDGEAMVGEQKSFLW